MSIRVLLAKEIILKLIQYWDEKQIKPWSLLELLLQLFNDSQTINEMLKKREEKRIEREQAANLAVQKKQEEQATQSFTPHWKFPIIDDDDEEYTIQYREYLERSSKAITPDLPTEEPDNSLSMGDEHLNTIPKMESDEVIKYSVEDLVPIPSESKDSIPPGIESDFNSEGDIIFLDNLLNDDPIPEYERFTFDIEPDTVVINNFDELNEDECFDPGGGEIVFPQNVKDDDSFTFVIQTFLPFLTYPEDSSLTLSSKSEDIIFDPSISAFHFSSLKPDCPDFEDSRARGFVHRPLDLQSFACLYWESDILNLID
ncbi:hypothetical protein Tco_0026249 [Tanacetum coccineum]